jgi:hypothetical protein
VRLALPVLALLAACSPATAASRLASAQLDTLPDGVIQVTNPGPTQWADTNGWRLVEERSIVPEEGSPGELSSPRNVVADQAGNIYVMQVKPTTIKVFAPDGTWLRNIGREGDGPGEFRDGMFGIARDTLFIQDPNNVRLTTFTAAGEFIRSTPSQCCWWSSRFPIFEDGTIGILGTSSEPGDQGALYISHLDGTPTDTLPIPMSAPDPSTSWTITRRSGNSSSSMGMSIPLQPNTTSAWSPDRRKVSGHTATYRLAISGLRGDTLRTFTAPSPTLTITDTQRDSIFEDVVEGVDESWRDAVKEIARKDQIPTTWPLWSGVTVDQAHRVWVGRPGPKGAVSFLDVFSPEGILLGTLPAPSATILDGYWTADHVYLLGETEEGFPRIRVFRLDTLPHPGGS